MRLRRNTEETYAFFATYRLPFRAVSELTAFIRSVPGCDVNDVVDESGSGFPSIQVLGEAPASQAERIARVCNLYNVLEDVIFPSLNEDFYASAMDRQTFKPGEMVELVHVVGKTVKFLSLQVVKKNRTRYALKDVNDVPWASPPGLLLPLRAQTR